MCCSRSKNASFYRLDEHTSWGHSRETLNASLNRDNTIRMSAVTGSSDSVPTSQQIHANHLGAGTILVPQKTASARLLFCKGAEATMSVTRDAPVGCSAKEGEKNRSGNGQPLLCSWCWEGNNDVSSHKPQRYTDETALPGHGKNSKHNFTLLLQVHKRCSGRSPVPLQLQPKPMACRLLQPTAMLSAQIITKDRPPSKRAFHMSHSLLIFPRKKPARSPSHTLRTGAPSETQPQRQRAQDDKSLSHTK